MTKNRNPVKQWEITFPQTDISREQFIKCFPPCEYCICAQEEHADGGLHLHLGIKLLKGLSHTKLIKYISEKFPNDWKRIHISPIKNWDNWNDYCRKEDPHVIIQGALAKPVSAVVKKAMEIINDHPIESAEEYRLRMEKERKEHYNAYLLIQHGLPRWHKKWDDELEQLKKKSTCKEDLQFWYPIYREQKQSDLLNFLKNWDPDECET